jgi:hypothetical protein
MAIDDAQDPAEALDDDELGEDYPPEEPLGVDEYGTTHAEERFDEPLEERIRREQPEVRATHGEPDPPAVLVDPDPTDSITGDGTVTAEAAGGPDDDIGAIDVDDSVAGDPTLRDVATEREASVSAEEAAVHVVDE